MLQINDTMNNVLESIKENDEKIINPIYARIKRMRFFTLSINQSEEGFAAVTTNDNFLMVQFGFFNKAYVTCYPLSCLVKFKAVSYFAGTYVIKLTFKIDGRIKKVEFTAAKRVINADLYCQEENLEGLISIFKRFTE
ncbi:MAG: hypothetical protein IJ007_01730 [Oscillospiraceae bacterium]|nr:hypothetical protein [Oscillospiraceae bacterium]